MNDPYKLNWFTSKLVKIKTPKGEEYYIKLVSKLYFMIKITYYKYIINIIKYELPLLLHYIKKLMIKYVLIETISPNIKNNILLDDPGIGGIKLKYFKSKEYSTTKKDNEEVIFLKPFKKYWADSKKSCKKGEWGNTNSLFANVWLEIVEDYTNYEKEYETIIPFSKKVLDHKIIKHLNNKSKKFTIEEEKEISNSIIKKFIIMLVITYYKIKDHILINQK